MIRRSRRRTTSATATATAATTSCTKKIKWTKGGWVWVSFVGHKPSTFTQKSAFGPGRSPGRGVADGLKGKDEEWWRRIWFGILFFGAKVTFSIFFKGILLFNFGVSPHFSTPEEVTRDTSGTKRGSGGQLGDWGIEDGNALEILRPGSWKMGSPHHLFRFHVTFQWCNLPLQ